MQTCLHIQMTMQDLAQLELLSSLAGKTRFFSPKTGVCNVISRCSELCKILLQWRKSQATLYLLLSRYIVIDHLIVLNEIHPICNN